MSVNLKEISVENINPVLVGTGTTAVTSGTYAPVKWKFNTNVVLKNNTQITIKAPCAGHGQGVYLSVDNGITWKPIVVSGTTRLTTHIPSGSPLTLIYDSGGSAASMYAVGGQTTTTTATITGGVWRVVNYYDSGNSNTLPTVQCETSAGTAAKVGTCTNYSLLAKSYTIVNLRYHNSYKEAITLNVNSKGAKPIYINGTASSSSNNTLPAGSYLVYYDGTNYYFRTDGKITGDITGEASKATLDGSGNTITSTYVKKTGDTITGTLYLKHATYGSGVRLWTDSEGGSIQLNCAGTGGTASNTSYQMDTCNSNLRIYRSTDDGNTAAAAITLMDSEGYSTFNRAYGAVWNDYAEYRKANSKEPGRCIIENGDDTLSLSSSRLQRGCEIISDTFGFAIGQTENCQTPIAVSGRVLAFPYEPRTEFAMHIGWPVCSGPNGTVSIMTEEEEEKYPSRIIGTISSVPEYEEWGTGKVKVNGRVWIRIK